MGISKLIGLSDKAIEQLKDIIQDETLKGSLNYFIENDLFIQLIEIYSKLNILNEYRSILDFIAGQISTIQCDNKIEITNKKEVLSFIKDNTNILKKLAILYNSYKNINITRHLFFTPHSEYEIEDNLKKAFLIKELYENEEYNNPNAIDNYLDGTLSLFEEIGDYIDLFEYRLEKTFQHTYQKEGVKNGSIRNNKK